MTHKYLLEAIKQSDEDSEVLDSWDMFTYTNKEEALAEAECIASGAHSLNARLMGYDYIIVHELDYDDESEEPVNCNEIASYEVK